MNCEIQLKTNKKSKIILLHISALNEEKSPNKFNLFRIKSINTLTNKRTRDRENGILLLNLKVVLLLVRSYLIENDKQHE